MIVDGSFLMGVAALLTSVVNAWRAMRPSGGGDFCGLPQKPAKPVRQSWMEEPMPYRQLALPHWRNRHIGRRQCREVIRRK